MSYSVDVTYQGDGTNQRAYWAMFSLLTVAAVYTNASLIVSVYRVPRRTGIEVLIGGLAGGTFVSSVDCFLQCFSGLVTGVFQYGRNGALCSIEAFLHEYGCEIQFCCIIMIGYNTYAGVVKLHRLNEKHAIHTLIFIYLILLVINIPLAVFSRVVLVKEGDVCEYVGLQPVAVGSVLLILIALPAIGYWYYQTYKTVAAVKANIAQIMNGKAGGHTNDETGELRLRLTRLVVLYAVCYVPGPTIRFLIAAANDGLQITAINVINFTIAVLYWVISPFAYGVTNPRLGIRSVFLFTPAAVVRRDVPTNLAKTGSMLEIVDHSHSPDRTPGSANGLMDRTPGNANESANGLESPKEEHLLLESTETTSSHHGLPKTFFPVETAKPGFGSPTEDEKLDVF